MKRGASLVFVFTLALAYTFTGAAATARAQSFMGKWVHQGPKGTSVMEFFPGEKRVIGPMRGTFRHTIVHDDGHVTEGQGHYIFRSIGPNRGWLTLHFSDGHVTRDHEHTTTDTTLNLRHHGLTRTYVRQ